MHEVTNFKNFAKGVIFGLLNSVKTDVDVFMIALASLLWPFKILRGFSIGGLFYVACRRADGLMIGYQNIKQREMSKVE